eukprot:TRINITY_DN1922_c0_g1_i2.p2 TRINITY_DN1922_c0_g1~~TRINITY_DN1922_c0_g1_i2.p2  ORF type:complete len:146 (+),score=59.02 TRINITY_DN1922_c0_g1_i2:772-1209(+)
MDSVYKDIASIVAEKCIDPQTKRPLTAALVERAMHDVHYSANARRSAKQQALDVIKLLQKSNVMPIERAPMRLQLVATEAVLLAFKKEFAPIITVVQETQSTAGNTCEFTIDPSHYRNVDKSVREQGGSLQFVDAGAAQGDTALE